MIKTPSTDHYCKKDKTMGESFERRIQPTLEGIFGPLTKRSDTDKYDEFDFSNERYFIDAKARRNSKHAYPTTMVGENKVLAGLNLLMRGYEVYFVFGFSDVSCLWRLDREQYEVSHGGRTDRGTPEIKSYCYIPVKYLKDIITTDAEESPLSLEQARRSVSQEAPEQDDEAVPEGGGEDLQEEVEAQD